MQKTILTIEDDFHLRELEVAKLKKEGFDVQAASGGEEFLKILESNKKNDLIILDLMLPDVNGFELLKTIKKDPTLAKTPVVVFSNLSEEKDINEAKKIGVSDFLVKSNFHLDDLIKKIREIVGK